MENYTKQLSIIREMLYQKNIFVGSDFRGRSLRLGDLVTFSSDKTFTWCIVNTLGSSVHLVNIDDPFQFAFGSPSSLAMVVSNLVKVNV